MTQQRTLLVCDCANTQTANPELLQKAAGAHQVVTSSGLCTGDLDRVAAALSADGEVIVTCGQQAQLFDRLSEEIIATSGRAAPFMAIDIRDRAGWAPTNANQKQVEAKQAALIKAATLSQPMAPLKTIESQGVCCIVGPQAACEWLASQLTPTLGVTIIITDEPKLKEPTAAYDVTRGTLREVSGALGGFTIIIDQFAEMVPTGRGRIAFTAPRDGAKSKCDIFIDVRGLDPAFPAHHKRNGYFWASPTDEVALRALVPKALDRIGSFEKTIYFRFEESLCAHSRAKKTGCTRCLDVCPTEAISSRGDTVFIDSNVCAGCGSCAAVCPTGAVTMTDPPFEHFTRTIATLAETYRAHAQSAPRLLIHDAEFGGELIRLLARHGEGLPSDVIPLGLDHIEGVGHAECLAALGAGFSQVFVLIGPKTEREALDPQWLITEAILTGTGHALERIQRLEVTSPGALFDALTTPTHPDPAITPVLLIGGRRDVVRLIASALADATKASASTSIEAPITLPVGAPYGEIQVNGDACTLCLACVSLCPTAALGDHPDKPEINFTENSCIQCGICANTCPESAITLSPQLNLDKSVLSARPLHGEEPFACVECGREFGVKSTIERIIEKLNGKHWMYTGSDNFKLIQMCDDCRINAQYHDDNAPMKMGNRPRPRTTDDYLDS